MPKKPPPLMLKISHDANLEISCQRLPRGERELSVRFRRPGAGFADGLSIILSDEDAERLVTEINRTIATRGTA